MEEMTNKEFDMLFELILEEIRNSKDKDEALRKLETLYEKISEKK